MPISISNEEIKETIHMIQAENLDIRTLPWVFPSETAPTAMCKNGR